ncbi:MAG: sugar phosphate isomerase/epimerase [Chloroflexota bacterium]|nr:sugar phosphate isomerase/epimerase [Chloroflexota bacterium]
MQLALFSKLFPGGDVDQLAEKVKATGFKAIELPVRPGYQCPPEEAAERLVPTVERLLALGVEVPIATAPVVEPADPLTQAIYEACGRAGVRYFRPDYWRVEGSRYWDVFHRARRQVKGLEQLSQRAEVKTVLHIHSGKFLTSTCATTRRLVEDCDPQYVGIYLSPPHMALDGEDVEMGLGIVGKYLSLVDHKNFAWERRNSGWHRVGVSSREGLVDWPQVIKLLREVGYEGIICFHSEYDDEAHAAELVARDREYVSGLIS